MTDEAATPSSDAAPDAAPVETPAAAATPSDDWRSRIPEDVRDNPVWGKVGDEAAAFRSLAGVQKMIGKDVTSLIELPDSGSSEFDAQQMGVLRQLGASEKAEDYKLTVQEGVPEAFAPNSELGTWFSDAAARTGLLPKQAAAIYSEFTKIMADADAQMSQEKVDTAEDAKANLAKTLGEAYEPRTAAAASAIDTLGPEFAKSIEDAGLQHDPAIVNAMAKVQGMLGEAKPLDPHGGISTAGAMSPAQLIAAAEAKTQESLDAMSRKDRGAAQRLQEEALALRRRAGRG